MVDTQDEEPNYKIELSEVGITDLKTVIKVIRDGQNFMFTPDCKITINLPPERKGAHLQP